MFHLAALLTRVVFHLPSCCVERIAQGDVGVFVLVVIRDEFGARNADVDVHAEILALLFVFMGPFDGDVAAHDMRVMGLKLLRFLAYVHFHGIGMGHVSECDLKRCLHALFSFAFGIALSNPVDTEFGGSAADPRSRGRKFSLVGFLGKADFRGRDEAIAAAARKKQGLEA